MKKKIIIPTDLTKAAEHAVKQAIKIAHKTGSSLTLIHVLDRKSSSFEEVSRALGLEAQMIKEQEGLNCDVIIKEGTLFEVIANEAVEKDYDLMVVGTHGIRGIKQMLFGADILKLVVRIPFPALVVQEESPLIESFHKVVLPVSSHEAFRSAIDAILDYSDVFDFDVHLYSINKPGFAWSEQMLKNIEEATRLLKEKGIRMTRVKEDQQVYSLGFAKQTVKYANSVGADALLMISVPTEENYYFAQSDKETMLLNEFRIPVVCNGGGKAILK
jgi:nucleotide-binding universal stress UspA family protein